VEAPVDVGIAVEPAVEVEVPGPFNGVVPAMLVAADEVVVAQHGGLGLVDTHRLRARGVRAVPWIGGVHRVVDVAALHHRAGALADADAGVPVDGRTSLGVELAVQVEPLDPDAAPAGDIAVHDPDVLALLHHDGVLQPAAQRQPLEQDVPGLPQRDERALAVVSQHEAIAGNVPDPAVG